jgi:adenylate kinase family enzyme
MTYQRIMIFGFPGAGKTTFALKLSHQLNLLLYHLDKYFFIENWVEREKEEFLNDQKAIVKQNNWIIDGNALGSLEIRYARADLVLYFCPPRSLCLSRLIKRRFFKDLSIQDRAEGCAEQLKWPLVRYMWKFDRRVQPLIHQLQHKYPKTPFYRIKTVNDLRLIESLFKKK